MAATDPGSDEHANLLYLRQFLAWARGLDLLDDATYGRLIEQVDLRAATLSAASAARAERAAAAGPASPARPDGAVAVLERPEAGPSGPFPPSAGIAPSVPVVTPVEAPPVPRPEPGGIGRSLHRLRELIASDMGVHGLAYLGVLLMFAGTFGFVFFAFGSLRTSLRPAAEAVLPAVFFASAWFLRRRDAVLVANSLELVGGALVPVVVFASLVDGAAVPPDLTGGALIAALTISAALVSVAYALWARAHPASALRFLAAPVAWLAVIAAGFALNPGTLTGIEIEQPSAAQLALGCVAIAATLAVAAAARFRERPLAEASVVSAVPGTAAAFALTLALAADHGWPWVPVAVASGATVVSLEFLLRRFGGLVWVTAAQCVVVGIGAAALAVQLGAGWAGAVAALCYVALMEVRRIERAPVEAMVVPAAGAVVGLAVSLLVWQATLVAWAAAALWADVVRVRVRVSGSESVVGAAVLDAAAAVLPVGVAAALVQGLPNEWAWLAIGGALVAAALVIRVFAPDDPLWRWWIPAAGMAASAGVAVAAGVPGSAQGILVAAGAACTAALALSTGVPALRTWSTAAAGVVTMFVAVRALGVPVALRPAIWAAAALVVAVCSAPFGSRAASSGVRAHWSAVGHVAAAGALVTGVAYGGPFDRLIVWACWIAVWSLDLLLGMAGRTTIPAVEAPSGRRSTDGAVEASWSRVVPALVLVGSLPAAVYDLTRDTAVVGRNPSAEGLFVAATGIVLALAARLRGGDAPETAVFGHGGVVVTAVAFPLALADAMPAAIVALLAVCAVVLLDGRLRIAIEEWYAWAASAAGSVAFASGLGMPADRLNEVLAGWGAVSLTGAFAADDVLRGRRGIGSWIRTRWLVPGAALGVVAVVVAAIPVLSGSRHTLGLWALAGAALGFAVAAEARVGALSAVGYALAVAGVAELAPGTPVQEPWMFVPMAGALVGISLLLSLREEPDTEPWLRWDLPPLGVAHLVAVAALILTLFTPAPRGAEPASVLATWVGLGALSFVVWVWRRRAAWEVAGQVLVVGGLLPRGPWVAAAALATAAVWNAIAVAFTPTPSRVLRRAAAAVLVAAAWGESMVAASWPQWKVAGFTALAAGVVVLGVAGGVRFRRLDRTWAGAFGAVAVAGLAASVALAPAAGHASTWVAIAVGTGLAAVAAGISAAPLELAALRPCTAVLGTAAAAALVRAHPGPASLRGLPFVAASFVVSLVTVWLWRRGAGTAWLPSLSLLAALTGAAGVLVAATAWPDASMLVAALAALGVESAVAAAALRRPPFLALSAVLLCGAWIVFADRALPGNPEWFAVPIGVAVLVVVDTIRWDARMRNAAPPTAAIVPMEMVGILFVAMPSLVQIVTVSPAYVFVSVAIGAAVMGWAMLTRVRRRAVAGAAIPLLALILVLAAPMARQIQEFHGVALWAGLAAVGVVCIVVATFLERGRAKVRAAVKRLRDATAGWE